MNQDRCSDLNQALALSREMLELAVADAWEEAATAEAERFRLLRQGTAAPPVDCLETRIAVLREIQALSGEILALGRKSKMDLAQRLRDLHHGRRAGKAYRQL